MMAIINQLSKFIGYLSINEFLVGALGETSIFYKIQNIKPTMWTMGI